MTLNYIISHNIEIYVLEGVISHLRSLLSISSNEECISLWKINICCEHDCYNQIDHLTIHLF